MAYNNNIPQGTTNISVGQAQILTNFGTTGIDSTSFGFPREHVSMTDATNGGIHKQVTFQAPLTPAAPTGAVSLTYSKTANAISELYFRNATTETQITKSSLTASSGEGFIAGGLQVRSGTASANGTGVTTSFSTAFPTACVAVVLTGSNFSQPTNVMKVTSFSTTGFVAKSTLGESGYFIAIGY